MREKQQIHILCKQQKHLCDLGKLHRPSNWSCKNTSFVFKCEFILSALSLKGLMWRLGAPSNCPYLLDILAASVDTFVITKQTHFLPVHLISVSEHWGKMGPDRCGLEI